MNMQSVKSRFTGSYLFLLILFVIQIPIVYVLVRGMNEKYAQVDVAGGLRMRAVEIAAILDRHIMTGNEELEGVFQVKKAEYPKILESFRTGNDKMAPVKDQGLLKELGTLEGVWKGLRGELDKGMEYGDELRLKKLEIENTTMPLVEKLDVLLDDFKESGDPVLLGLIDKVGDLKFSNVEMSFMFEKYVITFEEKDALTEELGSDIANFESILAVLKRAIDKAIVTPEMESRLVDGFAVIERDWATRKAALIAAFDENVAFQSQMTVIVDKHTPHLIKTANVFLGAISAKASSDATRSLMIMVVCVIISVIWAMFFMWMTGALVLRPLINIKNTVEKFARGDLTSRANIKIRFLGRDLEDEIYSLGQSVDEMAKNTSEVIGRITESSNHLANASEELSASATQIARGTEEQEGRASHVATASQQMSATVIEVAKNASGASKAAESANEAAVKGGGIVEKTIEKMNGISVTARESSEVIATLGSRSQEIGKIIKVIEEIADQTNLLALNAAIEAARAGEQGRGFAVVADEVRKLAERTGMATKEIGHMIMGIQEETEKAITTMDKEIKVVEEGVSLAEQAGASLVEISSLVDHVTGVIQGIAAASEEQSTAADQISGDIESVATITKETATGSQQIVAASVEMAQLASNLQSMVSMFNIYKEVSEPVVMKIANDTSDDQFAPISLVKQ